MSGAFLEHSVFLKRFLARFLQSAQDIEDVAQEAFLKAYSAEQDKGRIEKPKAFLFSIAKNLALNELSRKSRQMTDSIEECQAALFLEGGNRVDEYVEACDSIGLYCEAVANLPEKCRRVYLLRKVQGLSHKEIASHLGISVATVEKHLSVGVLSCRDYMARHGGEYKGRVPVSARTNHSRAGDQKNG